MGENEFVEEVSNIQKLKTVFFTIGVFIVIIVVGLLFSTIWYAAFIKIPGLVYITGLIKDNIANLTLFGLFAAHFIGGLFFIPSPDEVIFYYALVKGNPLLFSFIAANIGYLLAQLINYYVGKRFSGPVLYFVSKRKMFKTRRFTNKYGAFGIFIFNLLPFPAPLLTFALGIIKYNFTRLFFWTIIGKSLKYAIIIGFFVLV